MATINTGQQEETARATFEHVNLRQAYHESSIFDRGQGTTTTKRSKTVKYGHRYCDMERAAPRHHRERAQIGISSCRDGLAKLVDGCLGSLLRGVPAAEALTNSTALSTCKLVKANILENGFSGICEIPIDFIFATMNLSTKNNNA